MSPKVLCRIIHKIRVYSALNRQYYEKISVDIIYKTRSRSIPASISLVLGLTIPHLAVVSLSDGYSAKGKGRGNNLICFQVSHTYFLVGG